MKTVSYSITINGKPRKPFKAKKGLRQGNPMSPYLFVLGMEYFSRLLKLMARNPIFKYHPKCTKYKIIQLSFADDLLLFSKGDIRSIQLLVNCFQEFSVTTGLCVNLTKSSIFFGGVNIIMQQRF